MSNTIKPKRSAVAGNIPTTSNISQYEIAMNTADKKMYTSDGTNIIQIAAGEVQGLSDVVITNKLTGDSFYYNSTTGKWENKTPNAAKTILALNNVENKSSATIRSELTSTNVTSALGFTPYDSTNPNGYITSSDSITGNADTATKLTTARTISLVGDVTGSTSFDGSANVTINASVTPTQAIITNYRFAATAGQTVFTGLDLDNNTLHYFVSGLFVTLNGVVLQNIADYTATDGSSITLTNPTNADDEVTIYSFANLEAANVYVIGDDRYVQGPATSTDNALVRFDATTGRLIQNSTVTLDDIGVMEGVTLDSYLNKIGSNHVHYRIKASVTLVKGDLIKYVSWNAGEDAMLVAKVTSSSDIAIGMCDSSLANGEFGLATIQGVVEGFDTSAFSTNTILYPSSTGLTATKPTSGMYQACAFVIRSQAINGAVLVDFSAPAYVESSSNVGNTSVIRDASGNFSAGTITAALSGNASTSTKLATARTLSLSGDVTGSTTFDGSANVITTTTLANSGVTAGTYGSSTSVPVVTVDAKGRVTGVTTSAISGSLTFTGDVTGTGSTGSSTALTLANSGVTAGTYSSVTVDAKGRVTAGSNPGYLTGTKVDSFNTRTGAVTLTSADVTTALGFTPYNSTNPNGYTSNTGTVTSVSAGAGLTGGPITTSGTLSLANSGVTAGTYTYSTITVDAYGRLTSASSGAAPSAFPSGTAMLFAQTTAPTGWTKSITHNDKALRVVSGTAGSGGSVAFSTAFASKSTSGTVGSTTATGSVSVSGTVSGTTLSESQIPSHRHYVLSNANVTVLWPPPTNVNTGNFVAGSGVNRGYENYVLTASGSDANVGLASATGGSGSHSHGFSGSGSFTGNAHSHTFSGSAIDLTVQYVDVIIATKD